MLKPTTSATKLPSTSKVDAKCTAIEAGPFQLKSKSLRERRRRAIAILERLKEQTPHPRCELYYQSPYQLLISVVLSAQATDKSVNRCMEPIYRQGCQPDDVLAMGYDCFLQKIRSIGLAPTKAKNVLALTRILVEQYGAEVPGDRSQLEALPGVGTKTASVILGEWFGHPTLAVDTHVFRVGARLGLHDQPVPLKAEAALLKVIPKEYLPQAHHWLILHGRYTCVARKPLCESCLLSDLCPYKCKA